MVKEDILHILENVKDPEIPVLSVLDLGIVRDIILNKNDIEIVITPTYSGCPAMSVIAMNIKFELIANGLNNIKITEVLSPAWTTDWMTETGKEKLKAYGIAPPVPSPTLPKGEGESNPPPLWRGLGRGYTPSVKCPQCGSDNTELLSEYGSTACKSLMRCKDCLEPFDYFKCH
jgi:ring-1,2-phenylacetyl-CoA epoxidase subunit PaaD